MNSFHQTIQNIDKGNLSDDLAEKLAELVGKVKERGKAGSISLTIKVKPLDADAESVSLVAGVKVTDPAKIERASIFFTTEDNQLVRDNPKQSEMKLEPVASISKPVQPIAKAS